MCDTSRSRTAIVTLTLGGVYDQQQYPEHENFQWRASAHAPGARP